jgi:hypothetical protein
MKLSTNMSIVLVESDAKSLLSILGVSTPEDGKREWEEGAANPRL